MSLVLGLWLAYGVGAGAFTALVAALALQPGAGAHPVFRFVALVSFGAHVAALWPASIWCGRSSGRRSASDEPIQMKEAS